MNLLFFLIYYYYYSKETFQLSGFDEFATVPIAYPIDICLMEVANCLYAASLSYDNRSGRNTTYLKVFKHTVSTHTESSKIVSSKLMRKP